MTNNSPRKNNQETLDTESLRFETHEKWNIKFIGQMIACNGSLFVSHTLEVWCLCDMNVSHAVHQNFFRTYERGIPIIVCWRRFVDLYYMVEYSPP